MYQGGFGGYPGPPHSFEKSFAKMNRNDGGDLFRLMSKANRYSQKPGGRRKKQKADKYAYMTGAMLHHGGIHDPNYQMYHDAYQNGPQRGMQPQMLNDFRSGKMKQNRAHRRQQKGRYNGRNPNEQNNKGKKSHSSSMFDFFDSDTSTSSGEE